ncbi:bifunctional adenosylcobinamide kinase/adenosylcobinamide-phosphate guanylyltransferase [Vreelandella jeotgali]|uniref:bifunctional adenosylcobinamide kinase/adenosylcobinamide-phosphate guanylyltransferase n=1 Tax=Vreelandella jeotgali TaxID=553386 RepID=UPI00034B5150|nr:bifunctional adenosylcobinamide kinase/adenosylcobinamide-phosphate guanylyltransferase [Halomonas jeotgali]
MTVFVSGGARSGKSAVAEAAVLDAAGEGLAYYIATAKVSDDEMAVRVARHQRSRGDGWVTLEAPVALASAIAQVPDGGAALIDCLTLWASQVLYPREADAMRPTPEQAMADLSGCLESARRRGMALIIVSNDLNEALLPDDPETWRYVAFLQRAHRLVARRADSVLEVVAGQCIEWKPACRTAYKPENAGSGDAHR